MGRTFESCPDVQSSYGFPARGEVDRRGFPVANRDAEIARLRAENSSQNKALTMLATGIGNPPLAMFDEPIEDTLVKTALGEIARLRTELRRFEKQEPQP